MEKCLSHEDSAIKALILSPSPTLENPSKATRRKAWRILGKL